MRIVSVRDTATFIEQSKKKHSERFDYSETKYVASRSEVITRCIKHDIKVSVQPRNHLRFGSGGCLECATELRSDFMTPEEFAERSRAVHGPVFDFSLLPSRVRMSEVVTIQCMKHGRKIRQSGSQHFAGRGCNACVRERSSANMISEFSKTIIECFVEAHGTKYDYSLVEYTGNSNKVSIICPIHGEFKQAPAQHKAGMGCRKCGIDNQIEIATKTTSGWVSDAVAVHGSQYDYAASVYAGAREKLTISCRKHGPFKQTAGVHLAGHGCPRCSGGVSRVEQHWLNSLNVVIRHHPISVPGAKRKMVVDGYDPDTNTVYQFHGDFWHGNPAVFPSDKINVRSKATFGELYRKSESRDELIRSAGYNLVIMWEHDYKKSVDMTQVNRDFVREDGDIKDQILALEPGYPRPHSSKDVLGRFLCRFTNIRNMSYDPIFDAEIREKHPDWFINTSRVAKDELLMLPPGSKKPTGKALGRLHNYTNRHSTTFDADFSKEIRKKQAQWFVKTAPLRKAEILALPPETPRRPQATDPLGRVFANYICKLSRSYDREFHAAVIKRFPHWVVPKLSSDT